MGAFGWDGNATFAHDGEAAGSRVLLCVTGCIAAYKACEVCRGLQKAGCEVRVAMTDDAERFVGPATFEALTRHPVMDDLFADAETPIPHIDLTEWADLVLVCPATGNVLAKAACGIADDAVSTAVLAADGKLLLAPAMNVHMWWNPATQRNLEMLRGWGAGVVMPDSGRLACGDEGSGKLATPEAIVGAAVAALRSLREGRALAPQDAPHGAPQDLAGRRIVVTAGPTHEAIDPVRYIANRSSGKMGYAIARAAMAHGAQVTLVSGPSSLEAPAGCDVVRVTSAAEMHDAVLSAFASADAAVCAAAVADYTPAHPADHKLKKATEPLDTIELVQTRDILADISRSKGARVVVGFAAETSDAIAHAQDKLVRKGCDLIVANDVSRADSGFGSDTDRVALVSASGAEELPTLSKDEVAERIVGRVASLLDEARSASVPASDERPCREPASGDPRRLTIGAHLSISDGYLAVAKTAASIGATTFAYFTRNPRGGSQRTLDEDDINAMNDFVKEHGFGMLVAHAPYVYNLCSAKPDVRAFARQAMREDLERLELVDGTYYNFHPGSHTGQGADVGIEQIAEGLREVIEPGQRTCVLLETMAGKGTEVGRSFEELARIIDAAGPAGDPSVLGVCLDTCHVSDAGYDIVGDLDGVLDEFDRVIGLDRLRALHLNDSKNPRGAHKDRHERIGEGTLGLDTFAAIVRDPRLASLPMILETPNELSGWAAEIALLRGLAGEGEA